MKIVYSIRHSPLFYRLNRTYRLAHFKRQNIAWADFQVEEVEHLLIELVLQAISEKDEKGRKTVTLPQTLLIKIWEAEDAVPGDRTLTVHLEKIEEMTRLGYETDF